jgi:hypothetical protein
MADEQEPIYTKCHGCGYARDSKRAKIPKIRYHDKDEEEPKQPYVAGHQRCDDTCHPDKTPQEIKLEDA